MNSRAIADRSHKAVQRWLESLSGEVRLQGTFGKAFHLTLEAFTEKKRSVVEASERLRSSVVERNPDAQRQPTPEA